MKRFLILALIVGMAGPSSAAFNGCRKGLCNRADDTGPPPEPCSTPNAPDGTFDMSKCSNAVWAAVVF